MRTHVKNAKEETGQAPACTGALLEIKRIQRMPVKKVDSEYVGCAQYVVQLQIKKPKAAAGMTVFDRIRVGTPEDKEAQKKATWDVSEGGPARLRRLLARTGTALTDDDEEWMADAVGRTVVAPIVKRGEYTNVGLYYRENDKDAPEIGLAGEKPGARRARVEVEDDEDEEVEKAEEPDEDEEEEAPKKKKGKSKKDEDEEEEEEEDDEDEEKPAPKKKVKKPADDDEDEDDD